MGVTEKCCIFVVMKTFIELLCPRCKSENRDRENKYQKGFISIGKFQSYNYAERKAL